MNVDNEKIDEILSDIQAKSVDYFMSAIMAVIVLAVGLLLIKALVKVVLAAMKKSSIDESAYKFIISVMRILLYVVLLIIILTCLKVPTTPLITVLGTCGAAVALALKDNLSDMASGIIVLFKKPFKKDDMIMVDGYEGRVESIDITVTTIRTLNNEIITVPNRVIAGSIVVNKTNRPLRRMELILGISYDDDIGKARQALLEMIDKRGDIKKEPKPVVAVYEHGASAVGLKLRVWVATEDYYRILDELYEDAKVALDNAGISIPYDQLDIHIIGEEK